MNSSPQLSESLNGIHPPTLETESDGVHQIPVNKGFGGIRQPTELEPYDPEAVKKKVETPKPPTPQTKETPTVLNTPAPEVATPVPDKKIEKEVFKVPPDLLDYLRKIIAERSNVKSLIWDVTDRDSKDEVVEAISGSTLITPLENRDLLEFLGVRSELSTRKEEVDRSESVDLDRNLTKARRNYIEVLRPYIAQAKKDEELFKKMMASLGEARNMPEKDEPKELTLTRNEYYKDRQAKKEALGLGEDFDSEELEIFRTEFFKTSPKIEEIIYSGDKTWRNLDDKLAISAALAHDIGLLDVGMSEPQTFQGLRINEAREEVRESAPIAPEPAASPVSKQESNNISPQASNIDVAPVPELLIPLEAGVHKGEVLKVMEGENQIIIVRFDGKEIAKGMMTKKGPQIKLNKAFKAGFLLAKTPEQEMFERAWNIIKTFK